MKHLIALTAACLLIVSPVADAAVRSQSAKVAFMRANACPSTHRNKLPCPGYVIDHIKPLDCGGLDAPSNMQWQTIAEGKAKDKVERSGPGCAHPTKVH